MKYRVFQKKGYPNMEKMTRLQGGKMTQWGKMTTCNIKISTHRMEILVHVIIKGT